jgi:hypothetical protein
MEEVLTNKHEVEATSSKLSKREQGKKTTDVIPARLDAESRFTYIIVPLSPMITFLICGAGILVASNVFTCRSDNIDPLDETSYSLILAPTKLTATDTFVVMLIFKKETTNDVDREVVPTVNVLVKGEIEYQELFTASPLVTFFKVTDAISALLLGAASNA